MAEWTIRYIWPTLAGLLFFCSTVLAQTSSQPTVLDNVILAVAGEDTQMPESGKLMESFDVVRMDENQVFAVPRKRSDGTYNMNLLEFFLQKGNQRVSHDTPLFSRLMGHGDNSRRCKGKYSLHLVSFADPTYPGGTLYMMHVDTFPPSWSAPISSGRHFIQDQIFKYFGRKKDQAKITKGLKKRYGFAE